MDVPDYNLIALTIFILFAIFVPVSFLLTSKMLRSAPPRNKTREAPYESAEETIGEGRDVVNEYLPFFALFLAFELVSIVILLWSVSARLLSVSTNLLVIGLAVLSMVLALIAYRIIGDRYA